MVGVTQLKHGGTASLGMSSLTLRGGTDFINLCGHKAGDAPGNFWQPCREKMASSDGVLQIEVGMRGSDGRVIGGQVALPVCVQESNY